MVTQILTNYGFVALAIGAITFILTFAFKIPYKILTGHFIKEEDYRRLANVPIYIIPFGIAIGVCYLYSFVFNKAMSHNECCILGASCGVLSTAIYGAVGGRCEKAIAKCIADKKQIKGETLPEVIEQAIFTTDEEKAKLEATSVIVAEAVAENTVSDGKKAKAIGNIFNRKTRDKLSTTLEVPSTDTTKEMIDELFNSCIRK